MATGSRGRNPPFPGVAPTGERPRPGGRSVSWPTLFLLPTGTDQDGGRRPWAVWTVAFACVLVHIWGSRLPEGSDTQAAQVVFGAAFGEAIASIDRDSAAEPSIEVNPAPSNPVDPESATGGRAGPDGASAGRESTPSERGAPTASAGQSEVGRERDGASKSLPRLSSVGSIGWFLEEPSGLSLLFTFGLSKSHFHWWQPFTSLFLHAHGFSLHLVFNMLFLVAFGSVIEARLGRIGFLALFFIGGAAAGLVQIWVGVLIDDSNALIPCIGASGAISALMGLAFALHPNALVRGIAIPQFVIGYTSLKWMMAFAVALDIARTLVDWTGKVNSGIATLAHLGGLGFGLLAGLGLLASGLVARQDFDLLFQLRQWRRRREMRAAMLGAGVSGPDGAIAARVRADGANQETERQRTLRATLAAAHRERDYTLAAQLYEDLLKERPDAVLPAEIQLDVANELARSGRDRPAASAYTRFLDRFRTHPAADDARLMLAAILARRLGEPAKARAVLDEFRDRSLGGEKDALLRTLRQETEPGGPA